jgi:hypothetical protein
MPCRLMGLLLRRGDGIGWRKRDDVSSVVGWGCGAEEGLVGTGEGEKVAVLSDRAGFKALDEEDVWVGNESGGNKLVTNGDLSLCRGDSGAAVLVGGPRGDDGREKGLALPSVDLLGVNGASIVLITVGDELFGGGRHAMTGSPPRCRVFMLFEVSELEPLSWKSLTNSGAWRSSLSTQESCAGE